MGDQLLFTRYPLTTGISLSLLIGGDKERRGIYILSFSDGTEYVGQALDVVTRFRVHARKFREELIFLDFAPVFRQSLDTLELLTIRWRKEQGARLRNKLLVRESANTANANHWLPASYPLSFEAAALISEQVGSWPGLGASYHREELGSYLRLAQHPQAHSVVAALAAFLYHSVPSPELTERRVWVVAAYPRSDDGSHRLACLTVHNIELLTFFEGVRGQIQVTANLAPEPRLASQYMARDVSYHPVNGIMQRTDLQPKAVVEALYEDSDFRFAARKAASGLMHKGSSAIGAFHCRPLADAMYASIARSSKPSFRCTG